MMTPLQAATYHRKPAALQALLQLEADAVMRAHARVLHHLPSAGLVVPPARATMQPTGMVVPAARTPAQAVISLRCGGGKKKLATHRSNIVTFTLWAYDTIAHEVLLAGAEGTITGSCFSSEANKRSCVNLACWSCEARLNILDNTQTHTQQMQRKYPGIL